MGNLKSGEKWQIRYHYHEEKLFNRLDHQITTSKLVKPERNSIADPIHKYQGIWNTFLWRSCSFTIIHFSFMLRFFSLLELRYGSCGRCLMPQKTSQALSSGTKTHYPERNQWRERENWGRMSVVIKQVQCPTCCMRWNVFDIYNDN